MSAYVLPHLQIGEGPHRVIAVHGWFADRRAYEAVWPYLDGSAFSYAFVDLRGYGEAKNQPGDYTMEEVAADCLALADELGWPEFSLVGHSMGGKAIQQVWAEAPERVRRMAAINPVPASGVPFDEEGWALFDGAAANPGNRRAIIDLTTGNRLTGTWLDRMVERSLRCSVAEAFGAYLHAWAKGDFHERVAGSAVPVLVIAGEHDPALTADVMRATWLQWYRNAELEVMANAGHYPMDETPVALTTTIERFLAA